MWEIFSKTEESHLVSWGAKITFPRSKRPSRKTLGSKENSRNYPIDVFVVQNACPLFRFWGWKIEKAYENKEQNIW